LILDADIYVENFLGLKTVCR